MKPRHIFARLSILTSLPTRERELKLIDASLVACDGAVAPHAGARIETPFPALPVASGRVAPHAGARIETLQVFDFNGKIWSLPTRERELKPPRDGQQADGDGSLPTRERELKPFKIQLLTKIILSLPTRERELKLAEAEGAGQLAGRSPRGSAN